MNTNIQHLDHPSFRRLLELDAFAARTFPWQDEYGFDARGFGCLGLRLHEPTRYDYWCTPENVLTFASTGGDGVHFSFLLQNDEVTERSPVIITVPTAVGQPNWIGGENLYEFLSLGSVRGYFALDQFAYDLNLTLRVFTDPEWEPSEDWHYSVGFTLDKEKLEVLEILVREFGLTPWTDARRFDVLQKKYGPILRVPA